MRPNLLILAPRFPYPLEKGDKLRLYHQIKHLRNKFDITLVSLSEGEVHEAHRHELSKYCKEIFYFNIGIPNNLISGVKSLISNQPIQVCHFLNNKIKGKIHDLILKKNPDIIYVQLVRMIPYIPNVQAPKVLDIMDAMSLNMSNEAKKKSSLMAWVYKREARLLLKMEKSTLKNFDHLTIISERDRDAISDELEKFTVVPNGVSTDFFQAQREKDKKYDIGFIGNMGYLPNVNAAIFLIEKIIKPHFPKLKVLIAGARPDEKVKTLASENIHISGWMEDIREAYSDCKIFVAPLFTGAGLQNKILEAMSMGVPCITTSHVNQGCKAKPDEEIVLADTVHEFVDAIKNLLKNTENRDFLAEKGRKFVEHSYQWSVQVDKLINVLNKELDGRNS